MRGVASAPVLDFGEESAAEEPSRANAGQAATGGRLADAAIRNLRPDEGETSWLLAAKTRRPELAEGYRRRADLLERIEPLRRLTVLKAPSGFGKTSLLADVCRRWRGEGRLAAWLTLDEDDAPGVIDAYLAYAFRAAGLPLEDVENHPGKERSANSGAEVPHRARRRTELLCAAIEAFAQPCLLLLDDVERLRDAEAINTVDFLLRHGPRNLRFALAMRDDPGLDLEGAVAAQGRALSAADLRFSLPQIDNFLDGELPLQELDALERRTEGWPVALRIYRNMRRRDAHLRPTTSDMLADRSDLAKWFGKRLLGRLKREDRRLLLDLALFDWISPALADEALNTADVQQRIESLGALDGLLVAQEGDDAGTWRMNPLLKEYCIDQGQRENAQRHRELRRRIARLEARAGHLAPAMRHANQAGDSALLGEILEDAGGVRLWAKFGVKSLIATDGFLTPDVFDSFPRAALLHCTVLVIESRFDDALSLYGALHKRTRGFERDRPGGDDMALKMDHLLVLATLAGFKCLPFAHPLVGQALAEMERIAAQTELQPVAVHGTDATVLGALNLSLCLADQQRARFEVARRRGLTSKQSFERGGAGYGSVFVNLALGTAAMAQGRVKEAEDYYGQGAPTAIADILYLELEFERSAKPSAVVAHRPPPIPEVGWLDVHAAAYGVAAEMALDAQGARSSIEISYEYAGGKGLETVQRFLSALKAAWLVKDGFVDEADAHWRTAGLPTATEEILDLQRQSWREMEAIACARIRLLTAQGQLEAARALVEGLCRTAEERRLRRVLMNGIALSMATEHALGALANAVADLADFLRIAAVTDYLRPLARERETTLEVLPALLATAGEADVHDAAARVRDDLDAPAQGPIFTAREMAIVRRVALGDGKEEIATALGIGAPSLEAHLEAILRKTGGQDQADIAAAAQRLLSPAPRVARRQWRGRRPRQTR